MDSYGNGEADGRIQRVRINKRWEIKVMDGEEWTEGVVKVREMYGNEKHDINTQNETEGKTKHLKTAGEVAREMV